MTDRFEDFKEKTPTLVFDAAPQEQEKQPVPEPEKKEMLNDSMLTSEERQQVDAFAEQIDLRNSGAVLHYGVGTQKKLADFSERALNNVRTKDMGEVGNMIASLVAELKSFDAEEESKGIFGFLKKGENKVSMMKAKYNKVETNVNQIVKTLENHQIQLMKDIDVLDRMYEMNLVYFKELTMYILAGKKKLQEVRTKELPLLQQKARESGLPEDAQEARDLSDLCERFEKKLYDLELTRTVSVQTAPQIRMVQNADTLMAEKIQSTIVNTIPLWKSQMVIAIGVEHSAQAARAQREVTDMTNALLRKNADALKMATIESAKESERGIVDLETLKHTNETLITTLDEVMKIQNEGREKRRAAEAELIDMENQLKRKMLEISRI
ncbi:TelA-like protein [Eubacterium plexicaudatum ASF492]|uniref:Tellurite resistance protein n=1 Tax=Eubacterium plexicaudatum ASF492 TaxID=1235802 RepID=N2A8P2_9FIRM|nr:TelA-like protein [Eubacterium plexicaudatum ASF492]